MITAYCGPGRTLRAALILTLAGDHADRIEETRHLPDPDAVYLADDSYRFPLPPFELEPQP